MRRRQVLASGGALLGVGTAGCAGLFGGDDGSGTGGGEPPLVENRGTDVYVPTHVEGMAMADMASAGRYRFALSYSYPHRFWLVTGDRTRRVDVGESDTVHLMLSVWDESTGTVLPSSNTPIQMRRDGETVVDKPMWGMLSQNMGVHFGDNVGLAGEGFDAPDGTYEVDVSFGPLPSRQLGDFADALGEAASVSMSLEFGQADLQDIAYEDLGDRAGRAAAVEPMDMEMLPTGQLPEVAALPGRGLGEATSGDAVLAAVALESAPAGLDADGPYLAVSARTPYNRYPLPRMGLSAALDGGESVSLSQGLHPDLGFHYGAAVDAVPDTGELILTVDSPPAVGRHEGYETAFVDMEPATISF